jgi:hypothetical protein
VVLTFGFEVSGPIIKEPLGKVQKFIMFIILHFVIEIQSVLAFAGVIITQLIDSHKCFFFHFVHNQNESSEWTLFQIITIVAVFQIILIPFQIIANNHDF